eukprot:gene12014-13254_t
MASSSSRSRSWRIFENLCLGNAVDVKKDNLLHFLNFLEEERPLRDRAYQDELASRVKTLLTSADNKWLAICLLPHVIEHCDAETFSRNALLWMRSLQQFIGSKPGPKIRDLALNTISKLLSLSVEFDDISREISINIIHPLMMNLLALTKSDNEDQKAMVCIFRQCIIFYPGPTGRFRSQIENICLQAIDNDMNSLVREACSCLAVLPRCGSPGEKGVKFAEFWSKYSKLILNTLSELWRDLTQTEAGQGKKQNCRPILKISKVTEAEPDRSKITTRRICALILVLQEMIGNSFPNIVRVDVERIVSLCCALSDKDIDMSSHSIDIVCINASLPHIWQSVLSLLNVLIAQVNMIMLPYESTVLRMVHKILLSDNVKGVEAYSKPFSKLRVQAYQVLHTWALTVSPLLSNAAEKVVEHALNDARPRLVSSSSRKPASQEKSKNFSQSKKLQRELAKGEMTGKKINNQMNSDVAFAALKFLQSLISSSGPMLSSSLVAAIQKEILSFVLNIAESTNQLANSFSSPYGCTQCRMELYKCTFELLNLYHHEQPTPLSLMINIFRMGSSDPSMEVSEYCRHSLSLSDKLLRPSIPALREYSRDIQLQSNPPASGTDVSKSAWKTNEFGNVDDGQQASSLEIPEQVANNDRIIDEITPSLSQEFQQSKHQQDDDLTIPGATAGEANLFEATVKQVDVEGTQTELEKGAESHGSAGMIEKVLEKRPFLVMDSLTDCPMDQATEEESRAEKVTKRARIDDNLYMNEGTDIADSKESGKVADVAMDEEEGCDKALNVSNVEASGADGASSCEQEAFDAQKRTADEPTEHIELDDESDDNEAGQILKSFVISYPDSE